MRETSSNIVLIGMPGAGKSTVGVILAKHASCSFVDTDVLIQTRHRRSLQDIVDRDGYMELRRIEEEVLLSLDVRNSVIATGGSAVYSSRAMQHLKDSGIVVFLQVELAVLEARVHDYGTRGLAKRPDQDFSDLFQERTALYSRYADITICSPGGSHEDVCSAILSRLALLPHIPGQDDSR